MRSFLFLFAGVFLTGYVNAQIIGGGFKPGCYYDINGVKNEGYINQKPSALSRSSKPDNAILFKSTKNGKKHLVYARDIQSYVVNADSFAVVTIPSSVNEARYRVDFAKVLFDEKTKVFLIEEKASPSLGLSAGSRGAMPSINFSNFGATLYLYGSNGNSTEVMDKKNYKYILASVLSGYPDLLDRINNNQIDYDEVKMLSDDYFAKKKR